MNVAQWGVDQLVSELNRIQALAQAEWTALGQNSAAASDLYASDAIDAPTKAALEKWASRQAQIQRDFNTAYGVFRNAWDGAARFLNSIGLEAPSNPGLKGLGIVPALVIVPVVVVGAVTLAGLWFASIHESNLTQRQGLANQSKINDAYINGKITADQYRQMSDAEAAAAGPPKKPPGDPSDLFGMIVPALGLVAVILLGPRIMDMLPKRRAA